MSTREHQKKECEKHGLCTHYPELGKTSVNPTWRCMKCRSDSVNRCRKRAKINLKMSRGGKCEICGYCKSLRALDFHHLDSKEKEFGISAGGNCYSARKLQAEADKCQLICANCHRELHDTNIVG